MRDARMERQFLFWWSNIWFRFMKMSFLVYTTIKTSEINNDPSFFNNDLYFCGLLFVYIRYRWQSAKFYSFYVWTVGKVGLSMTQANATQNWWVTGEAWAQNLLKRSQNDKQVRENDARRQVSAMRTKKLLCNIQKLKKFVDKDHVGTVSRFSSVRIVLFSLAKVYSIHVLCPLH